MRFRLEWSLRVQVAVSFTALLCALFLVSFTAVYRDQRRHLYNNLDRVQLELARTELASAVDDPGDPAHLHASGGEHRAVLFLPNSKIVAASPGLAMGEQQRLLELALSQRGAQPVFCDWGGDRGVVLPAGVAQLPEAWLVLVTSRLPLEASLAGTRASLFNWGLLAALLGALASWTLAGWLTGPLQQMAVLARRVRAGTLSERLAVPGSAVEIVSLQHSLNAMLDELQANLQELQVRAEQQRRFLLDASHELRNPLHALMGTLEVAIRRRRTPEEYEESMRIALVEGKRLSALVQELLFLAQADLERLALKTEAVQVGEVMQECVQAHQGRAEELGIELQVEVESALVLADRSRLRQILDNLVGNALRYSPPGGKILLAARGQQSEVEVTVSNGGESLLEGQYEQIFQRFSRLDSSRKRSSGGTGLGLSIARELAEAQAGSLTGRAGDPDGSVFVLRLPQASGGDSR